jgi:CheY-like chemotaxis protein
MKRVLVVEDAAPIRSLLATVLGQEGYTVDTAADGESALKKALHTAFALVITDMTLPGMGGTEVIEHLRALELHGRTPVLVITAVTKPARLRACQDAGANAFIFKPFRAEDVLGAARALLARSDRYLEPVQGQ